MNNVTFLHNVKLLHLRGMQKDLEDESFIIYNLLELDRNNSLEMLSDCALGFARWTFGPEDSLNCECWHVEILTAKIFDRAIG